MAHYLYDVAKSFGFGVRNEAKAIRETSDADWRAAIGGIQMAKAGTSIFAEINKYDAAAKAARNTAQYVSKAVNPLLCVAALARVMDEEDKASAALEEGLAVGTMFAGEGIMKSQFKPGSTLAETQAIKRSVRALDNFCKSTRYLKNVKGNAVASALAGLAFIAGSVLSFETGHSLGEYIADNTTRKQPQMVPVEA